MHTNKLHDIIDEYRRLKKLLMNLYECFRKDILSRSEKMLILRKGLMYTIICHVIMFNQCEFICGTNHVKCLETNI